jgi:SAM-dependent methyltransferase
MHDILSFPLLASHLADPALRDRLVPHDPAAPEPCFHIDQFWVDDASLFLRGFIFLPNIRVTALHCLHEGETIRIRRMPRPDLGPIFPFCLDPMGAGFSVLLPFHIGAPITLQLTTPAGRFHFDLVLVSRTKVARTPRFGPFARFMTAANRPGARILEIGSRATSPGATPRRSLFPRAASFTGIDIHPGPGVDVVADVAHLAALFRPASFDYAFSLSVLEHLPAPWAVPAALHAVLAPQGELFHSVPFAFPLHEAPQDFWRFTHFGLATLFGPAAGFDILGHDLNGEARIIPAWRDSMVELPLNPAHTEAWIHARRAGAPHAAAATDPRAYPAPTEVRTTSTGPLQYTL